MFTENVKKAVELIRAADGLIITVGAGMGVDSGLPDFRGNRGLWKAYPALGRKGLGFQDIANPAGFDDNPRLAWGFYGHRLQLYRSTVPHGGFQVLLDLAGKMKHSAFVYTSNWMVSSRRQALMRTGSWNATGPFAVSA